MKRIYSLLGLGLGLTLCAATPSWSAATEAQKEAVKKLPEDFSNLLESTFYCRGVTGEKPYVDAKALTLSMLGKLTDTATAETFVAGREKRLEAGCPQTERDTCWADYLDMSVSEREGAKEECYFEQQLAMSAVVLTLQAVRGISAAK